MSIQTEITRLQTARNTLRTKAVELGIATGTDKMDVLANAFSGIENKGAVSATVQEGSTYTIPKGYHNGSGSVSITTEEKTITPTQSLQAITPMTGKVLSKVTVLAIPSNYIDTTDANALAGEILDGKTAYVNGVKIEGTMANNGAVGSVMDGISVTSVSIPAGYTSGGAVTLDNSIEDALAAI